MPILVTVWSSGVLEKWQPLAYARAYPDNQQAYGGNNVLLREQWKIFGRKGDRLPNNTPASSSVSIDFDATRRACSNCSDHCSRSTKSKLCERNAARLRLDVQTPCQLQIITQKSNAACVTNRNFGCEKDGSGRHSVWVDGGCRGVFRCNGRKLECGDWRGWIPRSTCSCSTSLGSSSGGLEFRVTRPSTHARLTGVLKRLAVLNTVVVTAVTTPSYCGPAQQLAESAHSVGLPGILVGMPRVAALEPCPPSSVTVVHKYPSRGGRGNPRLPWWPKMCTGVGQCHWACGYRLTWYVKFGVVADVLRAGFDTLAVDCDWRFQSDPTPLFRVAEHVSVLGAAEGFKSWVTDWKLVKTINVGRMLIRSSNATIVLLERVTNRSAVAWDQIVFNEEVSHAAVTCRHPDQTFLDRILRTDPKTHNHRHARNLSKPDHATLWNMLRRCSAAASFHALPPPVVNTSPTWWKAEWDGSYLNEHRRVTSRCAKEENRLEANAHQTRPLQTLPQTAMSMGTTGERNSACNVSLVQQLSRSACTQRSFGCRGDSMWVSNCRGLFNCNGAAVLCGFPPGSMYYRCSCSSGRDAQNVQQEYQSTKIRTDSIPGTNVKKVGRSVRADLEAMISGYNPDVYDRRLTRERYDNLTAAAREKAEVYSRLLPARATCAVVGSSSTLLKAERGREIDRADVVIRINSAPLEPMFAAFTGSRETLRVARSHSLASSTEHARELHKWPSTGLIAFEVANRLCRRVFTYGFGIDTNFSNCTHYYNVPLRVSASRPRGVLRRQDLAMRAACVYSERYSMRVRNSHATHANYLNTNWHDLKIEGAFFARYNRQGG